MKKTILLLCCFAPLVALAQTDSSRALSEVTVYASRINQKASELGRNVTVIKGSELARFPVNSLDDLLRCVPSLEVQSRGSFGAQADITMRGSTFNQVLILLDGLRLNDPLTGHFNGYLPITPAEIEQIEIVRGAGSAIYGPDAVGGVINIVTKTFSTNRALPNTAQATLQGGEWQMLNVNAGGYFSAKRLRASGGLLINKSDGQPIELPSTLRNDFDLKTYSLSLSYDIAPKLTLSGRAAFDRRDFNAQWFYTTSALDLSRETTSRNWWQAQARYEGNKHQTELQFAHAYSTDFYVFNPDPRFVPSSHQMWYTNTQLNHYWQAAKWLKLTFGGQYDVRRITSNDRGNHQTTHGGVYALATTTTHFGLTTTASLRYDYDQSYKHEWLPQLNLSYAASSKLWLRASAGRSIRAADFTERFVSNNLPGPLAAGRNIGNANLLAERAFNTELGIDVMPLDGLTFKITGFLRDGNNLIDYVTLPGAQVITQTGLTNLATDRNYRLAQNLFEVKTRGIEAELWYRHNIAQHLHLDAMLGYTAMNIDNNGGVVSQYLANFARQQTTGTITLSSKRWSWSLSGLQKRRNAAAVAAINRSLAPNYTVFHTKLDLKVYKSVRLTYQIHNLFNQSYADILGAQMPRRWHMGGVAWSIK
jgi:vitamin B12 transporter